MKKEVEIRFRLNSDQRKKILESELFTKATNSFQEDVYFCSGQVLERARGERVPVSKISPNVIRVRETDSNITLSYKEFNQDRTGWIEKETTLGNREAIEFILGKLGYTGFLNITKHRTSIQHDGIEINVDDIDDLGSFVEMEIIAEDVKRAKEMLGEFAVKHFGLPSDQVINEGYVQLAERMKMESI